MTLAEIISRHEAAQPAPVILTPQAVAECAARRFTRALAALDTDARTQLLAQVITNVAGDSYALLLSRPAPSDPNAA